MATAISHAIKCNSLASRTNVLLRQQLCTLFWDKIIEIISSNSFELLAELALQLKTKATKSNKYLYYLNNPHTFVRLYWSSYLGHMVTPHVYGVLTHCESVPQKSLPKQNKTKSYKSTSPNCGVCCLQQHIMSHFTWKTFMDNILR